MARSFTAVPGVVLIVCLFLPAMRVCGDPTAPITFPPCYVAYIGGIGVIAMALARGRRMLKFGAALPPTLAVLTVGGCLMGDAATAPFIAIATLWCAVMVPWLIVRRMPSERTMAVIALMQGLGSTAWATLLVTDKDGMWGADLTLCAGIALTIAAAIWVDAVAHVPELPRAIVR
ncbi:MAG TPA: hypothetical protein VGG28_25635 [Kofleriaceae bacterium]|jgi:hypothetical protein